MRREVLSLLSTQHTYSADRAKSLTATVHNERMVLELLLHGQLMGQIQP